MAQTLDPTITLSSHSHDKYNHEREKPNHQNHSKYIARPKEYEVEAILDVQGRGKYSKYLVKWKDLNESYNSWEKLNDLQGYRDLIREFMRVRNIEKARQYQKRMKENNELNAKKEYVRGSSNDSYENEYHRYASEDSNDEYRPRPTSHRLMLRTHGQERETPRHPIMKSTKHMPEAFLKRYDDGKMSHALLAESENRLYDEEPRPKNLYPGRDEYPHRNSKEERLYENYLETDRKKQKNAYAFSSTREKRPKPGFQSSSIMLIPEERHNSSYCEDSNKTNNKSSPSSSSYMHQNSQHVFPLKSLRIASKRIEEDTEKPDEYWIAKANEILGHVYLNKVLYLRLGWQQPVPNQQIEDRFFTIDEVERNNPAILARYLRSYIRFRKPE